MVRVSVGSVGGILQSLKLKKTYKGTGLRKKTGFSFGYVELDMKDLQDLMRRQQT